MTSTETRSNDVTPTFTESLLTHIALPVRDLEATLAFYAKYTKLVNIHERQDPETGLRTAWLANARDITDAGARFVIVLIHGKLPTNITGDIKEQYGFLKSISQSELGKPVQRNEPSAMSLPFTSRHGSEKVWLNSGL